LAKKPTKLKVVENDLPDDTEAELSPVEAAIVGVALEDEGTQVLLRAGHRFSRIAWNDPKRWVGMTRIPETGEYVWLCSGEWLPDGNSDHYQDDWVMVG
jgi:hypothetical protein